MGRARRTLWHCPPPPCWWAGGKSPRKCRQKVSKALTAGRSWSLVVQHPRAEMVNSSGTQSWIQGNSCSFAQEAQTTALLSRTSCPAFGKQPESRICVTDLEPSSSNLLPAQLTPMSAPLLQKELRKKFAQANAHKCTSLICSALACLTPAPTPPNPAGMNLPIPPYQGDGPSNLSPDHILYARA